jgi:hypothetical protein
VAEFTKERAEEVTGYIKEGATYIAGLDLGKSNDNTVYTILRSDVRPVKLAVQVKFPLDTPYTKIAQQISLFYKIFQPHEFNIDYSNEKSFLEILREHDVPVVNTKENIRGAIAFTNKNKSEMISVGRIMLENYQLQLPKEAELLISQFLNQQFEITEGGIYKYFHPSNEHDDMLWSTLLALKNITLTTSADMITFQNPWEKFDESVHGVATKSAREVLSTSQGHRMRDRENRYSTADSRRGHSFRM